MNYRQKNILKSYGRLVEGPVPYGTWSPHHPYKVILQKPLKGFKKAAIWNSAIFTWDDVMIELVIPAGSTVICGNPGDTKLRADAAKVVRITNMKGTKNHKSAVAKGGKIFKYTVGKIARPTNVFDTNFVQCSSGIHFFLHRRPAERY